MRKALPFLAAALAVLPLSATEPRSQEVAFTSPDGFTVKGTFTVPGTAGKHPVAILAHQFGVDRSAWAPLTDRLLAKGVAILALDLRGHGQSTSKGGQTVAVNQDFMASAAAVGFDKIPGDLAQAAAWVRKQHGVDPKRVALAGASVGAFSAVLAAPEVHPAGVLALSPAGTAAFGKDGQAKLKAAVLKARTSVLVLAAKDDKDADQNAQFLRGLPGVAVMEKDGDAHGMAFLKDRADLMAAYLGENLARRSSGTAAPAKAKGPVTVVQQPTAPASGTRQENGRIGGPDPVPAPAPAPAPAAKPAPKPGAAAPAPAKPAEPKKN